ncbi:MAG: PhzF family phenazine biosynthesis protein [Gemmatimonadota bacterium]|nr:MAG: PhzF family phenazine biosynthesis protein [Gemmatimonadota bacterium]
MRYRFLTCDVFTDRIFGGNPLAVFPDARGLDTEQMQPIAREFNLSETTFVLPPETPDGTHRVRIFTPATELPFAGHPTVGTAYVLAWIGDVKLDRDVVHVAFEEGVGIVPVTIRASRGQPVFAQLSAAKMPEFGPEPPGPETIAATLSLKPSDLLLGDDAPQAVSCGQPILFVPVRDLASIRQVRLKRDLWEQSLSSYWAPQVYVFTYDTETDGADIHARFFPPALGIEEDPATGAAATALAGYLGIRDARQSGTLRWVVEQGLEMGRPSRLEIEADRQDGVITAIRVGGSAVLVSEGEMDVPDRMLHGET